MPDTTPQLALVIPTYRWNALARETLARAAEIGSDDILVHIADNSENPEKHAFLRDLAARSSNVVVSCHERNIGAEENWVFLMSGQTTPYICMAADDDFFGGAYFTSGLALIRADPSCSAASGLHIAVAHAADGATSGVETPADRSEPTAPERIAAYRGQNSMCYAIVHRPVVDGFMDYVKRNPLRCPFNDYMLAFHSLSIGTYRCDRQGYVYVFDNTHWRVAADFIQSNARWYRGFGMKGQFAYFTQLHWMVVAVHFFSSRFRSPRLDSADAAAIVTGLLERKRMEFLYDYQVHDATMDAFFATDAAAAGALARLVREPYTDIDAVFDDFAALVAVFDADIARRYRAFQAETLIDGSRALRLTPPVIKPPLERLRLRLGGTPHERAWKAPPFPGEKRSEAVVLS